MPSFVIAPAEAGRTVLDVLRSRLRLSAGRARRLIEERKVRLGTRLCLDPGWRVRRGQQVTAPNSPRPKKVADAQVKVPEAALPLSKPVIRYVDDHLVVVDKPAQLTTVRHAEEAAEFGARAQRFLPPTLADLLPALLVKQGRRKPGRLRAVHRLDRDTSGLVVFGRTPEAERHLGKQFRAHTIERCYLAVVRGRVRSGRIESYLVNDRGDGRRGSTKVPGQGKRAVTQVRVLEELGDYSLVECRLETGRTHQVRIHLGEAGTPICGERIYDRPLNGRPLPDQSGAPRLALHAATLGFRHPATGEGMVWHSPLPRELRTLLEKLRQSHRRSLAGGGLRE
jgi:23S rRNA pseudouridine1911/1915/1917 synthase